MSKNVPIFLFLKDAINNYLKKRNPLVLSALFGDNNGFLYNVKNLRINDKTPINKIFGFHPTITLVNYSF